MPMKPHSLSQAAAETAPTPEALTDEALGAAAGGIEVHCVRVITQNDAIGTLDYAIDAMAMQPPTQTLKSS